MNHKSVTHGRYDNTVTFLASEHRRPSTLVPKLYCLVTKADLCKRLAQVILGSTVGKTRTRDLSITSQTFYHYI